jgi:uncharacterized membrane protein (UPF0182 family)
MRTPEEVSARPPRSRGRARWWVIAGVVVLVVLLVSLRSLATIYTDSLWFSSVHLHSVWSTLLLVKVGLFAAFGAIFFVLLWANLVIADRLSAAPSPTEPEDELVRRYQHVVRPYAGRLYVGLSVVLALIGASGTIGEWQNWILFTHAVSFPTTDPQFGKNVGFYVFTLPFLSFLVNWALITLVVVLVVTTVFHYLNGGIRAQRVTPRVRPPVKAHLSVLLALIALVKAAGYLLQRWDLVVSNNGYVTGAGYTDVHARIPALELLFFVSLFSAAILLYNIRRQGWTLPVLAIGIWAFVALVIGVIYPVVLQALRVNPAQSTLEHQYIARNISATRTAYGLNGVQASSFAGNPQPSASDVNSATASLTNARLWDPDPNISLPTFDQRQSITSYFYFASLGVDRYLSNGALTPVLSGVRQLNSQAVPNPSWVNTHLQYTHGQGAVLGLANQVAASSGYPVFGISNIPPTSTAGLPDIKQAGVYFGLNDPGYVVADSKQAENNFNQGNPNATGNYHYRGSGGVQLSNWFTRLAFTVRLGDFNLLISNLITPQSRIMFVRDIQAMAEKAAPFLNFDADPYGVVVDGHIDWVIDAYTTTSQYPYSQDSDTQQVAPITGLPGNYNYVRNSVKVVIDAYSGQMTFYAMDQKDPILRAYESAFPGMFTPASKMSAALAQHLRYPEDIFSIQSAIYGRYHLTNPSDFYNSANAWILSPTNGASSPSNGLQTTIVTNAQGQAEAGPQTRMAPIYQVQALPGQGQQSFTVTEAYVPVSSNGSSGNQHLTAFMMATPPRPGHPGRLFNYQVSSQNVLGPVQADSTMQQDKYVSAQISLLDQHGTQVILGNTLMIPVGQSMLYVRPLYVASTGNAIPTLADVVAMVGNSGNTVAFEPTPTAAFQAALGQAVSQTTTPPSAPTAPPGTGQLPAGLANQIAALVKEAQSDYQQALTALKNDDLATYAEQIAAMNAVLTQIQQLLNGTPASSATTTVPVSPTGTGGSRSTTSTTTARRASPSTAADRQPLPASATSPGPTTTTTTTMPNEA